MLQAIQNTIIVKPMYQKNVGNVLIPDAVKYKKYDGMVYGLVESVGSKFGLRFERNCLKQGDMIVFVRHEGKPIKYEGQEYLKLKERWILAKVTDG